MSQIVTVRLSKELADWLKDASRVTGVPVARIVRDHLERARTQELDRPYLRLLGKMSAPPDLSSRKGFSRK
jgi:predicted DNA-binding protein